MVQCKSINPNEFRCCKEWRCVGGAKYEENALIAKDMDGDFIYPKTPEQVTLSSTKITPSQTTTTTVTPLPEDQIMATPTENYKATTEKDEIKIINSSDTFSLALENQNSTLNKVFEGDSPFEFQETSDISTAHIGFGTFK